jgi:hypothetical protein
MRCGDDSRQAAQADLQTAHHARRGLGAIFMASK